MQAVFPPNWGDKRTESDARQTAASAADQDRRRARELEVLVIEVCFLVCRNPPQRLPRTVKTTARLCVITSPAHSQFVSTAPTRHSPAGIRDLLRQGISIRRRSVHSRREWPDWRTRTRMAGEYPVRPGDHA